MNKNEIDNDLSISASKIDNIENFREKEKIIKENIASLNSEMEEKLLEIKDQKEQIINQLGLDLSKSNMKTVNELINNFNSQA